MSLIDMVCDIDIYGLLVCNFGLVDVETHIVRSIDSVDIISLIITVYIGLV